LIPAALLRRDATAFPVALLFYLGGAGPPLAAILLVCLTQDREGRRDYWRRIVEFKRIGAAWYAVLLLIVPVLTALAALLDTLLGGGGAQLEAAARFIDQPLAILPFALFTLIFGPLPEEIGWRGYALDRLQARWNALVSSLILGAVWTLWHLPLFFIEGTYQNGLGVGTFSFWLFMLDKVPQSVLMTWVYNHNRRSTLSAVLFHFMVNFIGELFELTARADVFLILLWIVAAVVVTLAMGPEKLTRQTGDQA
jgi:membrane protease YdiL (CAAX protease family)